MPNKEELDELTPMVDELILLHLKIQQMKMKEVVIPEELLMEYQNSKDRLTEATIAINLIKPKFTPFNPCK